MFIDDVHPSQATKISYGWILKGEDKVIKTTGSRTRLNYIDALNLSDISATIVDSYNTINSESIARFFWKLKKNTIHLIKQFTLFYMALAIIEVN